MRPRRLAVTSLLVLAVALTPCVRAGDPATQPATPGASPGMGVAPAASPGKSALATFAGGCFWCMETAFEGVAGVLAATSGYAGGPEKNPTYEQVSSHATGHAEVVQVLYEPARISYEKLLDIFWHNIDPTVKDRQFCDAGKQYRSAIFVHDAAQRAAAEASRAAIEASKVLPGPVVTEIADVGTFWPAEEYHQDFYKKSPVRYRSYRVGCGRDARLKELWGSAANH